jgi:hypothetical protein
MREAAECRISRRSTSMDRLPLLPGGPGRRAVAPRDRPLGPDWTVIPRRSWRPGGRRGAEAPAALTWRMVADQASRCRRITVVTAMRARGARASRPARVGFWQRARLASRSRRTTQLLPLEHGPPGDTDPSARPARRADVALLARACPPCRTVERWRIAGAGPPVLLSSAQINAPMCPPAARLLPEVDERRRARRKRRPGNEEPQAS